MRIFPFRKMGVEKEIEFLYNNDLERVKKINKEKVDLLVIKIMNGILFLLLFSYLFYDIFYLKWISQWDRFPYFYCILIVLAFTRADDRDLRFLLTIDLLKRKIENKKEKDIPIE